MDDGRNRLRVIQDVSQQARFLLVTFLCRQRKVTNHNHAPIVAEIAATVKNFTRVKAHDKIRADNTLTRLPDSKEV